MNKVLSKACLLAVCSISLASCGTPTVVKEAKKYMTAHKESFEGWSGTLVYENDTIKINVVTGKGVYRAKEYKSSFKVVYNWEANKREDLTIKSGANSDAGKLADKVAIEAALAIVYTTVYAASAAYQAEQAASSK